MSLRVIGAGFGRTGTSSLKSALEILGFGPCHHMSEMETAPEQLGYWQRAAAGEAMDWAEVFRGYQSQVDWPGARFWRELAAAFPQAKVVLSERDPERWYNSMERTIIPHIGNRGSYDDPRQNAITEMGYQIIDTQQFGGRMGDRSAAISAYHAHVTEVVAEIPSNRLLRYHVGQEWGPLCTFLGVDQPDVPFPNSNTSAEFSAKHSL